METIENVTLSGHCGQPALDVLVQLGSSCIDIKVNQVIDNDYQEFLAKEKAHSIIFVEGLRQRVAGIRTVPGFLCEDSLYSEFRSTYESAFSAPEWVLKEYELWSVARTALPFLRPCMPYSNLLALSAEQKAALLELEKQSAMRSEMSSVCRDAETSGHQWEIFDILCEAIANTPESQLSGVWVYVSDNFEIQFDGIIESLETYRSNYLRTVIAEDDRRMSTLNILYGN